MTKYTLGFSKSPSYGAGMASYEHCADLAVRELDACRSLLADGAPARWSTATRCDGWDVEALARHLAAVAWQQGEAFGRARASIGEAPSWLQIAGDHAEVSDALALALDSVAANLAAVSQTQDRNVPLPFATLPAPLAAGALVLEYGVHRADLEHALGIGTDVDLDADVAAVVAGMLPLLAPFLAQDAPVTYRFVSESSVAIVEGKDADAVCEVTGSDAAISLLVLGRITPDHPAL
ncbi:MAG: hypothetical protein V7636_1619, partial [Actinomycetota bacterium]